MRFRKLRIAWSVACGVIAVLLIGLWVRSYFKVDYVFYDTAQKTYSMASYHGRFRILWTYWPSPLPAKSQHREFYSLPAPGGAWRFYNDWPGPTLPSYLGFESSWLSAQDQWNVFNVVPYWFLIFACSVAAVLPWLNKLFMRFSLRTLLIATALVAVVLGLAVWAAK